MKVSEVIRSRASRNLLLLILTLVTITAASAGPKQLILSRDSKPEGELKGVVDVVISPGFEDARVSVAVDGQQIADNVFAPYHIPIDFGALPVEHKITVTPVAAERQRLQWQTTVNHGHLPLTIKVTPADDANRVFEAKVTAPDNDPVTSVTLWDSGKAVETLTEPPYRFTLSPEQFAQQ